MTYITILILFIIYIITGVSLEFHVADITTVARGTLSGYGQKLYKWGSVNCAEKPTIRKGKRLAVNAIRSKIQLQVVARWHHHFYQSPWAEQPHRLVRQCSLWLISTLRMCRNVGYSMFETVTMYIMFHNNIMFAYSIWRSHDRCMLIAIFTIAS